MTDLPDFKKRPYDKVHQFASAVFTSSKDGKSKLVKIETFDDGHYRAIFQPDYFGDEEPTKSQWNTLKKRLKRHDRLVFVFKEHGQTEHKGKACHYIDFGFFAS